MHQITISKTVVNVCERDCLTIIIVGAYVLAINDVICTIIINKIGTGLKEAGQISRIHRDIAITILAGLEKQGDQKAEKDYFLHRSLISMSR